MYIFMLTIFFSYFLPYRCDPLMPSPIYNVMAVFKKSFRIYIILNNTLKN